MNLINKLKFLSLVTFSGLIFAQPTVAVLDFDAKGLPQYEVETLVERLRSELPNTKAVRLVDRKMIENILKEQGLQQSGCTTNECAAEIGALLGAQFMISGSIGKLGDTFTVDMKMVSVTTGEAERAKSLSFEGSIGALLIEMQILGWQIVGLKAPQPLILKRTGAEGGGKVTIAVMDFDPRGISQLEAQTLTDRFATELDATGKAILVDRRQMMEVMEEQGYDEAGCTSEECAAEVGALLGVKFMINGAIGKLGDTYTIDAKMFEVATGAAAKTKNATYNGPVDGLITEIEILAWELMGIKPPRALLQKRKGTITAGVAAPKTPGGAAARSAFFPGWGQLYTSNALDNDPVSRRKALIFFASEAGVGALAYLLYTNMTTSDEDNRTYHLQYLAATNRAEVRSFKSKSDAAKNDAQGTKDQLTLVLAVLGAAHVYNIFDAYMNGPIEQSAFLKNKSFDLVYNPDLNQPQMRFSIALD